MDNPRLLFVVTEDWYFASHRLDLARAARDAGFDVAVATRVDAWGERISREKLQLFPLRYLRRSNRRPWVELRAIAELTALYRAWRPNIVHHVAAKPIIHGGIAARRTQVPAVVSAIAGMGYVFSSRSLTARVMRPAMVAAYRAALRHPNGRLIVQNPEDETAVVAQGIAAASQVRRIRGAGVDCAVFAPSAEPDGLPIIMLVGRMLQDKGVREFVDASHTLRRRGVRARCVLVGEPDDENPASIPRTELARWHTEGTVEWWGHRTDMPAVLAMANVVCLPSYREGLPKVLLEAAACGRAMIATDVPGCREIAIQGETALLVPPRDPAALASAMVTLAANPGLRQSFGHRALELVKNHFSMEHVNRQTIALYRELLRSSAATAA